MYKLLTTAAVIMTVATPTFAWDGTAKLIQNLDTVYGGVDGGDQFTNLTNSGGELNNFLVDVDQGVTHISLVVEDDNTITPTLNEGKTLTELQESAGNLVNRINYDLFHDATPTNANDDGTINGGYDSATDYTIVATTTDSLIDHGHNVEYGVDPADSITDSELGLVGYKINTIVTNVDSINNGLVNAVDIDGGKTAAEQNNEFIAAYNGDVGSTPDHFGVNVPGFLGDIGEINTSITAAGGADFFGNTANFAVDGNTLNNFAVPGFTFVDNGLTDGTNTYATLLDWANAVNPPPAP